MQNNIIYFYHVIWVTQIICDWSKHEQCLLHYCGSKKKSQSTKKSYHKFWIVLWNVNFKRNFKGEHLLLKSTQLLCLVASGFGVLSHSLLLQKSLFIFLMVEFILLEFTTEENSLFTYKIEIFLLLNILSCSLVLHKLKRLITDLITF